MSDIRVTYYLGAGASAQSVPMVSQIRRFYKPFLEFIESKINSMGRGDNTQLVEPTREQFISITKDLEKHHTPDTLAKKLWLKRSNRQLAQLKIYLGLFFHWVEDEKFEFEIENDKKSDNDPTRKSNQNPIGGFDSRYDPFLATLLERGNDDTLKLPPNINIISWNYDAQIEKAFLNFDEVLNLNQLSDRLGIFPNPNLKNLPANISKIIKINGCARLTYYSKYSSPYSPFNRGDIIYPELLKLFYKVSTGNNEIPEHELINFAWETDNPASQESLKEAKDVFSKTQILVIIGYSFPTFNRKVDKDLFRHLPPDCTVYYQAPESDVHDLIGKLKSIQNLAYVNPVINLDQFHIPIEL